MEVEFDRYAIERIMKQWREDLLVFASGIVFWTVLWFAFMAGQGWL